MNSQIQLSVSLILLIDVAKEKFKYSAEKILLMVAALDDSSKSIIDKVIKEYTSQAPNTGAESYNAQNSSFSDTDSVSRLNPFFEFPADRLIDALMAIQKTKGFISKEDAIYFSAKTKISLAKIFGILSFYNYFSQKKQGKFEILVCDGTACHVKGSSEVKQILKEITGISPNQVSADGMFSIKEVRCLGACALAPVMMINGKIYGELTNEKIKKIISNLKSQN